MDLTTKIETWLRDEITAAAKPYVKAMAREAERHAKRQREIGATLELALTKVFATAPDDAMRERLRAHAGGLIVATSRALAPARDVDPPVTDLDRDNEIAGTEDDDEPEPSLARLEGHERPARPREIDAAKVGKGA